MKCSRKGKSPGSNDEIEDVDESRQTRVVGYFHRLCRVASHHSIIGLSAAYVEVRLEQNNSELFYQYLWSVL